MFVFPGKLLDDLNSLLHFNDGVRDSNHLPNDMLDLQSLLSGAGISSDALGAMGDDPDYRKLAGYHEELFKRAASGLDIGSVSQLDFLSACLPACLPPCQCTLTGERRFMTFTTLRDQSFGYRAY